jgi:hypothetical protein
MGLLPERDYSCGSTFCDDPACNTHGEKDADGNLRYWTPQRIMGKKAELRPLTYNLLSPKDQWQVDKLLGILDWDGKYE